MKWLGRIWRRAVASLIEDVPPSLEECEVCRVVDCTQERWLVCAKRLVTEERLVTAGLRPEGLRREGLRPERPRPATACDPRTCMQPEESR